MTTETLTSTITSCRCGSAYGRGDMDTPPFCPSCEKAYRDAVATAPVHRGYPACVAPGCTGRAWQKGVMCPDCKEASAKARLKEVLARPESGERLLRLYGDMEGAFEQKTRERARVLASGPNPPQGRPAPGRWMGTCSGRVAQGAFWFMVGAVALWLVAGKVGML